MGGGHSIISAGSRGFPTQTSISSDMDSFRYEDQAPPQTTHFCQSCASFNYRLLALGDDSPHVCEHSVCQPSRVTKAEEILTLPEESMWYQYTTYSTVCPLNVPSATMISNGWMYFKLVVLVVHRPTCVEWTPFVAMYDTRYVFYCGLCPTEHVLLGRGSWDVSLIEFVPWSANATANLYFKLDTRWTRKHECRSTINVSVRRPLEVLNSSSDEFFSSIITKENIKHEIPSSGHLRQLLNSWNPLHERGFWKTVNNL